MTMTVEGYLVTGISAMGGVIVWLALELRKMNNSRIRDSKEFKDVIVKIVEKNTEAFGGVKASIEMNTVATKNGAEQMRGSNERLANAIENLNRDVLRNKPDR